LRPSTRASKPKFRQLASAKNIGRGAQSHPSPEARAAIGVAFQNLVDSERSDFLKWAATFANQKARVFVTSPPKEWGELSIEGIGPDHELDFNAQIDWCTRVLERSIDLLSEYIRARARIEESFLKSNFEEALLQLDALEAKCGKSFWAIEARLCGLQDWKGLEAQKSFAAEIQSKYPKTPVAYIASYTSQRNEEKTNLSRFEERVRSRRIPPHITYSQKLLLRLSEWAAL